ncbi:hypothetical protein F4805DRAFT_449462 [Annulohypoxylon moriforme]|nr:hypothetical protein F4805DRAFT_449462 [Annulohypoxylon moriforme]
MIELAGLKMIEALVVDQHTVVGEDDHSLRLGPLFNDKPGLTLERWLFWEKRFPEEAECEE